jgi:hypothetical protein
MIRNDQQRALGRQVSDVTSIDGEAMLRESRSLRNSAASLE